MVSSNNLILAGVALVVGFFLLRGSSQTTAPAVGPVDIQEDQEISFLKNLLSEAQSLFKNTFKAPMIPKGLTTGGKTFGCRGPNCLGAQGAAGVRAAFDPFTGLRTVIGFTSRGSPKTQAFFGDISGNLERITQGNILASNLSAFIAEITNQLKIKQTNTV